MPTSFAAVAARAFAWSQSTVPTSTPTHFADSTMIDIIFVKPAVNRDTILTSTACASRALSSSPWRTLPPYPPHTPIVRRCRGAHGRPNFGAHSSYVIQTEAARGRGGAFARRRSHRRPQKLHKFRIFEPSTPRVIVILRSNIKSYTVLQ